MDTISFLLRTRRSEDLKEEKSEAVNRGRTDKTMSKQKGRKDNNLQNTTQKTRTSAMRIPRKTEMN